MYTLSNSLFKWIFWSFWANISTGHFVFLCVSISIIWSSITTTQISYLTSTFAFPFVLRNLWCGPFNYHLLISLQFGKRYLLNLIWKHISSMLGDDLLIPAGCVVSRAERWPASHGPFALRLWAESFLCLMQITESVFPGHRIKPMWWWLRYDAARGWHRWP